MAEGQPLDKQPKKKKEKTQAQKVLEALKSVVPENKEAAQLFALKRSKPFLKKLRSMGYSDAQIVDGFAQTGAKITTEMVVKVIGEQK